MYSLLPWKLLSGVLAAVIAVAIYIDDIGRVLGVTVPDTIIVRTLPVVLLGLFTGFFGPTGYWAPWRILWRILPSLNGRFPDLNGIWVGTTISNWPTIKKLVESAQSKKQVSEQELHDTPDQNDAMVMQITNSLFVLRIDAGLSSTDGESHSITAKPWRHQHTKRVHLSYVYEQQTPNHASTDEEKHLGAADLVLTVEDFSKAEGTYWTRRSWRTGRNTAGMLALSRLQTWHDKRKNLREYAAEHKASLDS